MVTTRPAGARGIDEILADARGRLRRLTPRRGVPGTWPGARCSSTSGPPRSARARARYPVRSSWSATTWSGAWIPSCEARLPWVTGYDHRIIVFCVDGYTSSLAAVALHDLGLHRATDLIGGFRAWSAAGLPTAAAGAGTVTLAPGAAPVVLSAAVRV